MSDEQKTTRGSASRSPDGDNAAERALHELFAHAEPREAPPAADAAEIRAAVFAEWDARTGRRVLRRRAAVALVAAAAIAGVAVVLVQRAVPPGPEVATVERVHGTIEIGGRPVAEGGPVRADTMLSTGAGEVALRLRAGASLRLASQTRARLDGDGNAQLLTGRLYFDSARSPASGSFAVRTDFGTLRDVGTQFLAELVGDRLAVSVRDGRVMVDRGGERVAARTGERLSVPRGRARVEREATPTYGDAWIWVDGLAPSFAIDGRRLVDFLDWVERETGRRVVYADADAERTARDSVLRGSIDLAPLPKLTAVLALTDLDYSLDGERIVIRSR